MPHLHHRGLRIHYEDRGEGRPLLLLHAGTSSCLQWRRYARLLGPGHRLITPDLPGHGGSDPSPEILPDQLLPAALGVLDHLLGHLDLRAPLHLVGHSLGGLIALLYALQRPGRTASLTLFEPVVFELLDRRGPPDLAAECHRVAADCLAAVDAGDPEAAQRRFITYWSGPAHWQLLGDQERAHLIEAAPLLHRVGIPATFNAGVTEPALRALTVPTLLLDADRSPAPARAIVDHLAALIPAACRRTIQEAGHMAPITHAPQVAALLRAHI
jgi:pimeloyl-ACP methyl ester carboxylesterase